MAGKIILREHESQGGLSDELSGIPFVGNPERGVSPRYLGVKCSDGVLSASYYVGTSWLKEDHSLLVEPKIENVDLPRMLGEALKVDSDKAVEYFSSCYGIEYGEKCIDGGKLASDFLILLIMHYIVLLKRVLKFGLRQDYITVEENLKSKVRGKIHIPSNIAKNTMNRRSDRVYCSYQVYTCDIPENRLLKKALLRAERILRAMPVAEKELLPTIKKIKGAFSLVGDDIDEHSVRAVKASKLYRSYSEAIRVAKLILRNETDGKESDVSILPPFWIDMSALFEMYVYSLLSKAYPNTILFQVEGSRRTRCDYIDTKAGLIIDAKYKPGYSPNSEMNVTGLIDDVRELSGYARDGKLIKKISGVDVKTYQPPCIIIYPEQHAGIHAFDEARCLIEQCIPMEKEYDFHFRDFYKIGVRLPCK